VSSGTLCYGSLPAPAAAQATVRALQSTAACTCGVGAHSRTEVSACAALPHSLVTDTELSDMSPAAMYQVWYAKHPAVVESILELLSERPNVPKVSTVQRIHHARTHARTHTA
jgi:hypothetical protein